MSTHADPLLDPANMAAAINAALTVAGDEASIPKTCVDYVALLDYLVKATSDSTDRAVVTQAAVAGVVSVLMRGAPGSEMWKLRKLSTGEARARITRALFVHHTVTPLPRIVVQMAHRLLPRFPKAAAPSELQVRVIQAMREQKKGLFKDDFKEYRRLLEPIALVPAPNTQALASELARSFPWMANVTEHIVREVALGEYSGRKYLRLPRLLLVGEPGVGKTFYVKALAKLLGAPFRMISAAGESDSMSLKGTSAGWSSARPSVVIQTMLRSLVANPVFLVDELDKAGRSRYNGSLQDTLLPMLDPVLPWPCPALETEVDLSYANFVATANSLASVPRPLLDRLQIVHAPKPSREHFPLIIDSVLRGLAAELEMADHRLLPAIAPAERDHLVRNCENVRQLARAVRRLVADKAAGLHHRQSEPVH